MVTNDHLSHSESSQYLLIPSEGSYGIFQTYLKYAIRSKLHLHMIRKMDPNDELNVFKCTAMYQKVFRAPSGISYGNHRCFS